MVNTWVYYRPSYQHIAVNITSKLEKMFLLIIIKCLNTYFVFFFKYCLFSFRCFDFDIALLLFPRGSSFFTFPYVFPFVLAIRMGSIVLDLSYIFFRLIDFSFVFAFPHDCFIVFTFPYWFSIVLPNHIIWIAYCFGYSIGLFL